MPDKPTDKPSDLGPTEDPRLIDPGLLYAHLEALSNTSFAEMQLVESIQILIQDDYHQKLGALADPLATNRDHPYGKILVFVNEAQTFAGKASAAMANAWNRNDPEMARQSLQHAARHIQTAIAYTNEALLLYPLAKDWLNSHSSHTDMTDVISKE